MPGGRRAEPDLPGPGSHVTVAVTGFAATHALRVTVGGTAATIDSGGTTSSAGAATVTFTVPATLGAGSNTVVVTDTTSTLASSTLLTVT